MARLSQEINKGLSLPVLKLLENKNIFTVLNFLEEDPDKMCNVSGLSFKDVIEIRRNILEKYSAKRYTGIEIYRKMLILAAKISTGIQCLDEILEGGMLTGNLYEVCGLSGVGKTQICFTVASHLATNLRQPVHFVDTKSDFSASRMCEIMQTNNLEDVEIQSAMELIKVSKINDIYKLISFLHQLESTIEKMHCRLIIIDSLPVLYTPFINEQQQDGLGLLNHIASTMKKISTKYQTVFLIVNIATVFFDADDIEGKGGLVNEPVSYLGDVRPGMGKAWQHTPSCRLLIQKPTDLPETHRTLTVVKSTDIPLGRQCTLELARNGFVPVIT